MKNKGTWMVTMEAFVSKHIAVCLAVGILVLVLLPFAGLGPYIMRVCVVAGIYYMLGMGLNILVGYTGLVSLGQCGFYAIGAYTAALLMLRLQMNFFPAMLLGASVSALCGLLLGLPTLRLSGSYLSIATLGFGEIVRTVIMNWTDVTNGTLGLNGIPRPWLFGLELTLANNGMYYLMLVLALAVTAGCYLIIHSKIGRAFRSIKEDELAATMMGIKTTRYKVLAFVISAWITGLAGAFYAPVIGYIDHNSFVFDTSILIVSIVILGGMGTFRGMLLGAALLIAAPEILRPLMEWRFVVYGLILVIMMRFRPQGILGWRSQIAYRLPKREG